MKIGKLSNSMLENLVFSNIQNKRSEVITRSAVGEDCAVINFEDALCVTSTDPITGATKNIGSLAVHISCNDVASNGAEPIGILMTILLPESSTEQDLEQIMKDAGETASKLNVEIIGGHTEVTDAVTRTVISTTVLGKQPKKNSLSIDNIKVGDKVLITKVAALEGTYIIANELEERLEGIVSNSELQKAKILNDSISVVKEGIICGRLGANYMHDITEGGILGAVWEASEALGKGIRIVRDRIPLYESTKSICNHLDIDPLRLISSGSMLIISSEEKARDIVAALDKEGVLCTVIGEVIEDGVLLAEEARETVIKEPGSDELYKVI